MHSKNTRAWVMTSVSAVVLSATCMAWATPPDEGRPSPPDPSRPRNATPAVVMPAEMRIERIYEGWSAYPIGASATSAAIPENTVQMFRDTGFRDDLEPLDNVMTRGPGGVNDMSNDMEDAVSSIRWNLSPGIVVVFYEDENAKGEQLPLWGKGEMSHLHPWNFNDKASSWGWYYAGGAESVTTVLERAAIVYPTGTVIVSREVPVIPLASVNVYRDKNFRGPQVTLSGITAPPPNQLNSLPEGMKDDATSMRWNLPPGVVVMFHQDADGDKQRAAIWGNGEASDIDAWDFNDKISRWSWHYIGSRNVNVLGYAPPVVTEPARVAVITPAPVPQPRPETVTTVIATRPVGTYVDPLDLVGAAIAPNNAGFTVNDLVARKNPNGQGTFVYAPRVMGAPAERRAVWLVMDSNVYAINPLAQTLTPTFSTPLQVDDVIWVRTGFNRMNSEQEMVRIVFN